MNPEFEIVYTVTDWYDGPREGTANYRGAPHHYRSVCFDADGWDADEDRFQLTPITEADLALALEDWAIWRRWEDAFNDGLVSQDSHPALPTDRQRHDELSALLAVRLRTNTDISVAAHGEFRPHPVAPGVPFGRPCPLAVRWRLVDIIRLSSPNGRCSCQRSMDCAWLRHVLWLDLLAAERGR